MDWQTMALLGAYDGINPGMGWLFAVALGVQQGSARCLGRAAADRSRARPLGRRSARDRRTGAVHRATRRAQLSRRGTVGSRWESTGCGVMATRAGRRIARKFEPLLSVALYLVITRQAWMPTQG